MRNFFSVLATPLKTGNIKFFSIGVCDEGVGLSGVSELVVIMNAITLIIDNNLFCIKY